MAVRTSLADVQKIVPDTLDATITAALIVTANQIINDNLLNENLSAALLLQIETFLTAHLLYSTVFRQTESKKVGDAADKYATLGKGLESTTYGSIVKQLDTSGILGNIGKSKMVIEAIPSFDDSPLYLL